MEFNTNDLSEDKKALDIVEPSQGSLVALVPGFSKMNGLINEQLNSYQLFVTERIKEIVRNSVIAASNDESIYLRYIDVNVQVESKCLELSPGQCRLDKTTYSAPIYAEIEYVSVSNTGVKEVLQKEDFEIGRMPIMLRSCCCVLDGKDEEELAKYGEYPLDPGGYFIIKGTEKVILMQEQPAKNTIIVDTDKKGCVQASVTSWTNKVKSKIDIRMEDDKIYLYMNDFTSKVPIIIVLKAMGMVENDDIFLMVGEDSYRALLYPSMVECAELMVNSQCEAIKFLDHKVKKYRFSTPEEGGALIILEDAFLAHVPVHGNDFHHKCLHVAVMLRRMMEAIMEKDNMDDKDYFGNRRLELSGQMLARLFEYLFKTMNACARRMMDKILDMKPRRLCDFSKCIDRTWITNGMERAISTGNWNFDGFKMDRGSVTMTICRPSYTGTLGYKTMISTLFQKSNENSGTRALHSSQSGMFCPFDTPGGEACGSVKKLAPMTHVTTDEDEKYLIFQCYNLEVEKLESIAAKELHMPNAYLIILNGLILGKHPKPQNFTNSIRDLRRAGKFGDFVSIYVNEKQRCVYISSDGGRVCRPLVIADRGVSRIKEHHMKELKDGARTFQSFLKEGMIEYLDVNELNNASIALNEEDATEGTTHIEIEPPAPELRSSFEDAA